MFENLQEKLQRAFKNLRGQGMLTEENIQEALKEIRMALLEADVNFKVVKTFIDRVQEKAIGQEVMTALSPAQQVVQEQSLAAPTIPVAKAAVEPFSTVTFEAVTESHLGGVMDKMPLLRRLRRTADFVPPRPVQETTPTVPEELLRTLRTEVPLDVRVYINKSGKVEYAELLSDVTAENRDFASLAVFNARHWEFKPAQSETRVVPGRAMLHYRFGNPLLAISRDQK